MNVGLRTACPSCKRRMDELSWTSDTAGTCWHCKTPFEFLMFPAARAQRRRIVPRAVLVSDQATCFHHAENQADASCEVCGKFLCTVCSLDFGGRTVCPTCLATAKDNDAQAISRRTLWGGIAMGLAVLPLLLWPLTALTAPTALVIVIIGWRKPASVTAKGRGRGRLIFAGVLALIQITVWVVVLARLWLGR